MVVDPGVLLWAKNRDARIINQNQFEDIRGKQVVAKATRERESHVLVYRPLSTRNKSYTPGAPPYKTHLWSFWSGDNVGACAGRRSLLIMVHVEWF
ncbi:hypothetical protein DMENIID0001_033360 [Sergentomyia squamirostris]